MGDLQRGAIAESDFPFGEVVPGRAAGGQVALILGPVGEGTVDGELKFGDRTGAAGDPRDLRNCVDSIVAPMDASELDRDDDGSRSRDIDVGVDEEERGAAMDAAIEEDYRAFGGKRRLFGKCDLDLAFPSTDDRIGAGLLSTPGRARHELVLRANRQALGVHLNGPIEVGDHALDRGRMATVDGSDPSVEVCCNRRLLVLGQLGRRDPAVVSKEEIAHPDDLRLG